MIERQNVSFPNGRGQNLAGVFVRPLEPSERAVVLCHGFTGSRLGGGSPELAGKLARRGWASLAFDFAGCGDSEGDFADLTLSGQVADLTAAVDWCVAGGVKRLVTLGRSFGGSTVICQAALDRRVDGVVTFAAVARLLELFTGFAGRVPMPMGAVETAGDPEEPVHLSEATVKRKFFVDLARWDVSACAGLLTPRPLLVLHGTDDGVVPPEDAELLYRVAGEPREKVLVPGADHQFSRGLSDAWQVFLAWLDMASPR